jgi:hypothetical protein
MRKVLLFHLNPIEQFPPVLNLIRFVDEEYAKEIELLVISTPGEKVKKKFSDVSSVKIARFPFTGAQDSNFSKIIKYIFFSFRVFFKIIKFRPEVVMYYETISVIPVFLYSLIRRPVLFIHYHEYMTTEEYASTGFQRYLHVLEGRIYQKARWISHTNSYRLDFFRKDNELTNLENLKVMENFPSKVWARGKKAKSADGMIKFVYVGALSLENMYIREFFSWITKQVTVSLDIYSQQDTKALEDYMSANAVQNVFCKGFVPYDKLPELLPNYDIGLIWYRPYTPNFIYNAPNKLFEYYACGLEVWLPVELKGALPYLESEKHPRIIQVDFSLESSLTEALNLFGKMPNDGIKPFFYEDVYRKLIKEWLN